MNTEEFSSLLQISSLLRILQAVPVLLMVLCNVLSAGDWPQILGPNRDGVARDERLADMWEEGGPEVVWQADVGNGFAGVAVASGRVVSFVREAETEVVRCYESATGKVLWESKSPCTYRGGVSSDKGPRCVPTISGDRVLTLGVQGLLRCISIQDGQEIWHRDTTADFRPLEGYFGVGSTPVVYRDRVIVNVGGRDGSSIVAFSMTDGTTVWQAFSDSASYSSPVIMTADGMDLAVVVTRLHLVGVDPVSGMVRFSVPYGARGPTVNGATPILMGNRIFVSSSYNIGSLLVTVDGTSGTETWRDEEFLATQYATPVASSERSSLLFAIDGRQDSGRGTASLKCLDVDAKKVLWEESGFDYGSLIRVQNELLAVTCGGELIRVAASAKGYSEVSRSRILKPTESGYRLPALSGGRLFVRDDSTLKCLRVGM